MQMGGRGQLVPDGLGRHRFLTREPEKVDEDRCRGRLDLRRAPWDLLSAAEKREG